MHIVSFEHKSWSQRPPQFAQTSQCPLPALIVAHFKCASMRNSDFDVVALFQFQCVDHCSGQPHSQAVSPFCNLHKSPWIYIADCISISASIQLIWVPRSPTYRSARLPVTSVCTSH